MIKNTIDKIKIIRYNIKNTYKNRCELEHIADF